MASPHRAPVAPVCPPEVSLEGLRQSLEFAARNAERLDRYESEWGSESEQLVRLVDRVCTEASLLLMVSGRVPQIDESATALRDRIAQAIAPRVRTERMRDLLRRCPQFGVSLSGAHLMLASAGYPDAEFDGLVVSIFSEGYHRMEDRPPWQTITTRWIEHLAMGGAPATFRDIVPFSLLGGRTHPIYWRAEDGLAVSRSLFGMTDFGRQPLPPALRSSHVRAIIDAALVEALFAEDFENLLRFLIASVCVGDAPSAYAALAREQVERTWKQLGFLPGSRFEAESFTALAGDAAAAYAFSHLHVANFLGGVLCALELGLRPVYFPPTPNEIHPLEPWIARRLAIRGTAASLQSAWVSTIAESRLPDRDLLRILSDGVLMEACRQYDLALLMEAIEEAPTPATATRQEAEAFLDRQRRYQTL